MNRAESFIHTTDDGNIEIEIKGRIPLTSRKSTRNAQSMEYREVLAQLSHFNIPKIKGKVLFHFTLFYPESNIGLDFDNVNLPLIQDFATAAYLDPPDDTSKRLIVFMDTEFREIEGVRLVIVPFKNFKKYFTEVIENASDC